jgi:hypothetical protein
MIGEAVVLEQRREGAGAAPEAERVDGQHRKLGGDVIAAIARGCVNNLLDRRGQTLS